MIKTKHIDLDTISELLAQEQKRKEVPTAQGTYDIWYVHGFPKKMVYLFDLPYEKMFVPWKSQIDPDNPFWHCIGCGAMVKNRESHFNWHKKDLGNG